MKEIRELLECLKDEKYAEFQRKLIPNISQSKIMGVKTNQLKDIAKSIIKEGKAPQYISKVPYRYFEEMQICAFIIVMEKNFDRCIKQVEKFLPYIDNWATCDQLLPKTFAKNKDRLLIHIKNWIKSEHIYTRRFAVCMLMKHFLDKDFAEEHIALVLTAQSGEYYIDMGIAWYMATALAKQWDSAVKHMEKDKITEFVFKKSIQKAKESRRVSEEHKKYLAEVYKKRIEIAE